MSKGAPAVVGSGWKLVPVVAYGYENTRPTGERHALMMVKLENVSDQYPELATPLVRQSDAQAALAAKDVSHEKQLNACKSLIASLERQRTMLREGAKKSEEAVKSLLSEREANAILTNEIAALTAERDALRKDAVTEPERIRADERERCAQVVEQMTSRKRTIYAMVNSEPVADCPIAAAIHLL